MDWLQIVTRLALDWRRIGTGLAKDRLSRLTMDWQQIGIDWRWIGTGLPEDRLSWLKLDWHSIGDGLAMDWYSIGEGSSELADIGLALD